MTYPRLSDCGNYQVIPVNSRFEQVVPVVQAESYPVSPPSSSPPSAPPHPSKGFRGFAIGAILTALALAVLTGGDGESPELVQLRRENQLLKQRIDQLEYTLMGIYSAPQ